MRRPSCARGDEDGGDARFAGLSQLVAAGETIGVSEQLSAIEALLTSTPVASRGAVVGEASPKRARRGLRWRRRPLSAVGSETEPRIASHQAADPPRRSSRRVSDPAAPRRGGRLPSGGAVRGDPGAPEESVFRQRREHARRGGILRGDGDDAVAHDERDVVVRVHGAGRHVKLGRHELGSHREAARTETDARARIAMITARMDAADVKRVAIATSPAGRRRARGGGARGGLRIVEVDFPRTT